MFYKWEKHGWQHKCLQHGLVDISSPLWRSIAQKRNKNFKKILLLIGDVPSNPRITMEMHNRINDILMPANIHFTAHGFRSSFDFQICIQGVYSIKLQVPHR